MPRAAVYTGTNQLVSVSAQRRNRRRRSYSTRRVDIDIKDADIHNILRLLAREGGVNIITSDAVKGSVTLHLERVPWDQALDIILKTKGLGMVEEGRNLIRIVPIEDLVAEQEAALKAAEASLKAKEVEVKQANLQVSLIPVNHAEANQLLARVNSLLTERGKAEVDVRTNTLIVKDVADVVQAAQQLVSRLDTQTPQVYIEARIVEVNDNNSEEFGIQWGGDALFSSATGNPTGLRFPSLVGLVGSADDQQQPQAGFGAPPNFAVNLPSGAGLGSGGALGVQLGSLDGTFNLNVRLSALESRGVARIVSSPKITTLDNKEALISQGTSIPISQITAAGVQTVFVDAVLQLRVTPHVTQDGNIYLKLQTQNDTPDFQNVGAQGDPTILKKTSRTTVLLKNGETSVIGGIYTRNSGFSRDAVPFFSQIPIIGYFFRRNTQQDLRSELLIFITPRIVNQSAATVRTGP